jgi:NAD(P)-dependent dehydrogenase (short-subunit alcohol dehydrogenase family)
VLCTWRTQAGHLALPFWSAYNVSKAGLDMLSECLRYELQPQGVAVVLVKPGPVVTPIWQTTKAKSEVVVNALGPEAQQLYGAQLDTMVRLCCCAAFD